jgi:hypothetical protein
MTHEQLQQAFDNRRTVRALVQVHDPVLHTVQQQQITVNGSKNDKGLMVVTDDGKHWYTPVRMWVSREVGGKSRS